MSKETQKILLGLFLAGTALDAVSCAPASKGVSRSMAVRAETSPWQFAGVSGVKLATRHYRIFTTTSNRSLLEYLPGFMECAYEQYLEMTSLPEPPEGARPMPVYLLADRQQWAVMTESLTGPRSRLYLSIQNGGYCYRGVCVFWDLGHFATFSIASHEGLHQFFHHRLRDPIPAWAEEGLCVSAEGFAISGNTVRFTPGHNPLRMVSLRDAISGGRWIGLKALLTTDAADHVRRSGSGSGEYYAQLWALMMFIRSDPRYAQGLAQMVADAASGRLGRALRVPPAMGRGRTYNRSVSLPIFRHYITPDLTGFEQQLREFAARLAKLRQDGGRTIRRGGIRKGNPDSLLCFHIRGV